MTAHEDVDVTTPNPARMYDYFLGGSHNFAADREAAERAIALMPDAVPIARANRQFLRRAVEFCRAEGLDQFLDLGSGIPTVGNVHEVARRTGADARVAYVDVESVAVQTAASVLDGDPLATVTQADLRDPDAVLAAPGVRDLLDLTRPVALLLVSVLHFVPDSDDPAAVVAAYRARLAPGSFVVLSHATLDLDERAAVAAATYRDTSSPLTMRTRDEVAALLTGLDLVEPGIVEASAWRPEPDVPPSSVSVYAAVGRVPARHQP